MSKTGRKICLGFSVVLMLSACFNPDNGQTKTVAENTDLEIGMQAPELAFSNPKGEEITLSSLQGKMVLIDFWASWCPPCRHENPKLVKIYHEFKNEKFKNGKGFAIYSVSCDKDKQKWIEAIDQDKLVWDYHVSDLKGWEAEATYIYNINSIPSNILIDGNGMILAKNLMGDRLNQFLKSQLK